MLKGTGQLVFLVCFTLSCSGRKFQKENKDLFFAELKINHIFVDLFFFLICALFSTKLKYELRSTQQVLFSAVRMSVKSFGKFLP